MKELTVSEIEKVSGGDASEAAASLGIAMGIGGAAFGSKVGTIALATAFSISPIAVFAMVGLSLYAGYRLARTGK